MSYARARRRVVSLSGTVLLFGAVGCSGTLVYDEQELAAPDASGDKTDDPDGEDVEQTEFTLDVQASHSWSDTGVDLERGEMFSVLASGTIDFGSNNTGPEGYGPADYDQYNVVSCTDHAALIGRIGQDGEPFFLGAEAVSVATDAGRLYLGPNDSNTGDNSGAYAVRLTTRVAHDVADQSGVTIPATVPWTDTGVEIVGGDVLMITASGKIDDSVATPESTWGPAGKPNSFNSDASIIGCAQHVALLGRIGASGALFVVGQSHAAPAAVSGRLFLGLNDKILSDEGGKLAASVTLIER
ncbi:MAG TPA: hypothetical protein VIG06_21020 [Kofleriaceae bacterium]|jgi:alpha-D-ribose 1-methylphosphonate 5-triphosphate synthase subunit PhnG